jgi:hypothetical protein
MMRRWLGGMKGGLAAFLLIAALVAGGLGWVTQAAVRLEREQLAQQAAAEHADRLRLALWQLDNRVSAVLAREDARPFSHYSAVFAPTLALDGNGRPLPPGSVVEPSPLLNTELPSWMLLHFQTDTGGWESPQVLSRTLHARLAQRFVRLPLGNVTDERRALLAELNRDLPAETLLARARKHTGQATVRDRVRLARLQDQVVVASTREQKDQVQEVQEWRDYASRMGTASKITNPQQKQAKVAKNVALLNFCRNGEEWLNDDPPTSMYNSAWNPYLNFNSAVGNTYAPPAEQRGGTQAFVLAPQLQLPQVQSANGMIARVPPNAEVAVSMSPMVGRWLATASGRDRLVAFRLVKLEEKEVCQGIVLDGDRLAELLADEVRDLFPDASIVPVREAVPEQPGLTMTSLPLRLDPGPQTAPDDPGWTPLRVGLTLAWAAALVALAAVGLGGWSLLDLSNRRIRFVWAVSHELRTPLTTLQLYLDMLLSGLVRAEPQRQEYLQTLHAEADRLARLVNNVLDYSRLETQQPKLALGPVDIAGLLDQMQKTWETRCGVAGKVLLVENLASAGATIHTDVGLLLQVLGNLIDNACKYSRDAEDRRLWLRARAEPGKVILEVEDRGPGVAAAERGSIFRPFRRGRESVATTGGVGLGLALARRWAELLSARVVLHAPAEGGACFRVELPA